tara:strand:- start:1120 stop:1407 length:288 start_codon:yes stop_codon:yes gene_type:complete
MLSYTVIKHIFNKFKKLFENIKTKILNSKKNLIKIKDNYIENIVEIKFSIYNKYIVIKNRTKTNYYNYKEKSIVVLNTHYNNFYTYWCKNYDKIK